MSRIGLTGYTGFVGKSLMKQLHADKEIIPISLRDPEWKSFRLDGMTAIIHLAGKAHDTANTSSPEEYYSINRDLTIELFEIFLRSEVKDFFYFSSVKAAADSVEQVLLESTYPNPLTPYGKSKLEAEKYLLSKRLPVGKRLFIIRPCMIHGPGNKGNLNLLYQFVQKGIPWPLGSFQNYRSFLGIDNLCFLIERMLEKASLNSGIYNFADDEPLSTNELIKIISESTGKKSINWKFSKNFITAIAKIGDIFNLQINSQTLKKLTESYVVSNHKIKEMLEIDNLPKSTKEGLVKTIMSFTRVIK